MPDDDDLQRDLLERCGTDARILEFLDGGSLQGLWYRDLRTPAREWTSAGLWRALGYDAVARLGPPAHREALAHPDDLARARRQLHAHCTDARNPYDHVIRYTHRDGHLLWMRCRGIAIRDANGRATRMLGVHTDGTPRANAEAARLRRIVEAAPTAMLAVGPRGRIDFVNAKAEGLFGYDREELLGAPVELLLPERFAGAHPGFVHRYFAEPSARPMGAQRELFARRKDGREIPVEIGLNPIHMPDGVCVVASVIDITERKRSQDSFRRIVEGAPNAAIVVDARGRITLVNRAAETLFGYPRDELVGEPIERLVPEDVRARHPAHVAAFHASPRARPMGAGRDLYGRSKDGRQIPIEIGLNPIETPEGPCTLASVIDITERKQREDELRRSNAELEQFAYVASHDLQEPLRMVANYTQLLAERYRGQLDERADRYIHFAVDGARRMQQLVADLLAFSRVGSQGRPFTVVDPNVAARDVLASMATAIADSGAEVVLEPMPAAFADASQLRQLLQNLVGNALKFRSTRPPRVVVSGRGDGARLRFSVADNGIGIDARHAERIFQMFQRLHPRGEYDGSGIGLAIARRIVERHGGEIWFESVPGEGTTFHFTLDPAPEGVLA